MLLKTAVTLNRMGFKRSSKRSLHQSLEVTSVTGGRELSIVDPSILRLIPFGTFQVAKSINTYQ
jgi:hypothetical protein